MASSPPVPDEAEPGVDMSVAFTWADDGQPIDIPNLKMGQRLDLASKAARALADGMGLDPEDFLMAGASGLMMELKELRRVVEHLEQARPDAPEGAGTIKATL